MRLTATAGAVLLTLSLTACGGGSEAGTVLLDCGDADGNYIIHPNGDVSIEDADFDIRLNYGTQEDTLAVYSECTILEDNR